MKHPVDLLIQPGNFFSSLKISICVCHFGIDLLIWPVTLAREIIEITPYVQNPVGPLIQPDNFFSIRKFQYVCDILALICRFGQ